MKMRTEQLRRCGEKLRVYDADQNGWEQETNGFAANVQHVHLHLSRDVLRKDFKDRDQVRAEIAPDALAYGLRLGRWAGLSVVELAPGVGTDRAVSACAERFGPVPDHFIAWNMASSQLGDALHGLGHRGEFGSAAAELPSRVKVAAQLLLSCADLQSVQHDFSLEEALDVRLAELRGRFGIPEPVA